MIWLIVGLVIFFISIFFFTYPRVKEHLDKHNRYMSFCYYNYFDQVDNYSQEYVAILQGGVVVDSDELFYRLRDRVQSEYPYEQYQIVYVP